MDKYRMLVVDIDGTLLDRQGNISADDRNALEEARRRGIHVCLCTGRSLASCAGVLQRLSLDGYHVSFDGALVSRPATGEEIYARPIAAGVVRQMVQFARQKGVDLELFSTTQYFAERETWSTEAHRRYFGVAPALVDFDRLWRQERIIKGGLVTASPPEEAVAEAFCRHFATSLHPSQARTPAYPGVTFINILALGVSKGSALEALARHLKVPLEEVMAVGDGTNDIALLYSAGLAVAMGDAPDELRAVADYITLDVEHSGLAAAVRRFLL